MNKVTLLTITSICAATAATFIIAGVGYAVQSPEVTAEETTVAQAESETQTTSVFAEIKSDSLYSANFSMIAGAVTAEKPPEETTEEETEEETTTTTTYYDEDDEDYYYDEDDEDDSDYNQSTYTQPQTYTTTTQQTYTTTQQTTPETTYYTYETSEYDY